MEGEFVTTSVNNFFAHYLPFEPSDIDVEAIVNSMLPKVKDASTNFATSKGTREPPMPLMRHTEEGQLRFDHFLVPPCKNDGSEKQCFEPLQNIADAISGVTLSGRTRNKFRFQLCPSSRIESDIPGSNNIIDACITSKDAKPLTASGIAVVFEFKLAPEDAPMNNRQVVSANVQIMNDDVRRMFAFGVTIEADMVTLWYHSRSHSAVSEPFSFVEEPRSFIKLFISFLFATEEELGYDPMVIREDGGAYLFRMPQEENMPDRFFRIKQSLSEYRSNNISGRMARVWQVAEYPSPENQGPPMSHAVLKDVWLDASADTEKEIQAAIFQDIERFFRLDSRREDRRYTQFQNLTPSLENLFQSHEYKKYFLEIQTEFIGRTSKSVAPDSRRKTGMFRIPLRPLSLRTSTTSKARKLCGTPRPTTKESTGPRIVTQDFAPKKQYRVVFAETCKTVGDLETLGEVADVLEQALVALRLLYCAGWVHRDISSGNILAHRKHSGEWQVKLSDLEYARKYPPPLDYASATDAKTGTPYFMPHEILTLDTIYSSQQKEVEMETADKEADMSDMAAYFATDETASATVKSLPHQVIVYNFQHDLESVWWIFIWTITSRIPYEPSMSFATKIFKNTTTLYKERADCLLRNIQDVLEASLAPSAIRFARPLERLRQALYMHYVSREREGNLLDIQTYCAIHAIFAGFFLGIRETRPSWGDVRLEVEKPHANPAAETSASHSQGSKT